MGIVHPDQSIIRSLKGGERSFVQVLADGLSDSWSIFTRQDLWTARRAYEIDVLLMHEKYGFLSMEVKDGQVTLQDGEWYREGVRFDPSPVRQAMNAMYALRDHIRGNSETLKQVNMAHAVVFPDVLSINGALPPSCTEDMLFLNPRYENIESVVINCIFASGKKHPLSRQQIEEFYSLALPSAKIVWDPEAQRRYSIDSMKRISDEQIRALRSLDINDRVLVSGVAGSGKTRLALMWAHQSARAGHNTLLSCYNDPLGRYLQSVSSQYPTLTVGPFLRTVSQFPGVPSLGEPDDPIARNHFWNVDMINHLYEYADQSEVKFDTIVLDERQDFNDEWMEIIEKLLVGEDSKILCVADPNQDLYDRGFFMPDGSSPWALAELRVNCRNTREIANFVKQLGGGTSASASPEGDPVIVKAVGSEDALVEAVLSTIQDFVSNSGVKLADIVVITGTAIERERFYELASEEFSFSRWEDRTSESIACETAKRAKGIEAEYVIVATLNQDLRDNEMYVAASRARTGLVIIGPEQFATRFRPTG